MKRRKAKNGQTYSRGLGHLALLVVLLLGASAQATTLVRMDLDQLTAAATIVARARCVSTESQIARGEVWTLTTFDVLETLKRPAALPSRITVRLIGGRAGHVLSKVEGVPHFVPGEEVYLFLEPNRFGEFTVTSWAQGTFRVRRYGPKQEKFVTQDLGGLAVFDPATRSVREGGVRSLPLPEFRRRVSEAVERLRRKELQP